MGAAMGLASIGLSAAGSIAGGMGQKAGDDFRAAELRRKAEYGRMAADETNANLLDKLNITLGNIDAVRAAEHTDPTSPTTGAISDRTYDLANQERSIRLGNIYAQVSDDEASAAYLNSAGSFAMTQGYLGAAAGVFKGLGGTNWNSFG